MTNETRTGGTLLVRKPSPLLASGQITHIAAPDASSISYPLALEQWKQYTSCFTSAGWKVLEVPPVESCPDSVFIEDPLLFFGDVAVIASPGTESREEEIVVLSSFLQEHSEEIWRAPADGLEGKIRSIEKPGTLDGGDVLKVGKRVYVGRSSRTDDEGIRQLEDIVQPLGYEVVGVPVTKALHLKSAVTALPDGTVIGYEPIVDDPSVFESFLGVQEEHGVAVVVLTPKHLVMSSDAPRTTALLRERGYQVDTVDISQFEMLEGCVTCLSVRVRA